MSNTVSIEGMSWRLDQLSECVPALLRMAGLCSGHALEVPEVSHVSELETWVHQIAKRLSCEAYDLTATYEELERELIGCFPAVIQVGDRYLAIAGERRGCMRVLCPDSQVREMPVLLLCAEIRWPAEEDRRGEVEEILERCGIPGKRRTRAADVLLLDELGQHAVRHGWLFREASSAPLGRWLKQVHAIRNAVLLLVSHSAAYGAWLLSWAVLGSLSLSGHMDRGWLFGWSLSIASFVVCRVLGTWYQGRIAVGVSGLLKRRLLEGVLRLDPGEIRHEGVGSFLGQTFEADAIEKLALGGGIAGLLATVDLLFSGFVLGRMAILLTAWFGLTLFLSWRFLLKYEQWTTNRLSLTQDLVEAMVGHRTRLVQQPPEKWHEAEDGSLDTYYAQAKNVDYAGSILLGCVPRGWLVLGLACIGQSVVAGGVSSVQTAVHLGGILLVWNAFERLVESLSQITAAYVASKRIGYLFGAARRPELLGSGMGSRSVSKRGSGILMEVERLTFRYRQNGAPVLDGCGLDVRTGDRILLEGPSGGGKTTLASLLAGARRPESGLILAGGLDMQTLGREGWRKHVVLVPQFHENHVLTETLAFNLLCGRRWPPTAADMEKAERVCRGLGLGSVLDRMPNGLLQMVGDGGWQLSHGERSRLFIARALIQDPALMILDESFGALDPESLRTALNFTLDCADSLMVIAHP